MSGEGVKEDLRKEEEEGDGDGGDEKEDEEGEGERRGGEESGGHYWREMLCKQRRGLKRQPSYLRSTEITAKWKESTKNTTGNKEKEDAAETKHRK